MKTVSNTSVFVDTNILYYLNNQTESFGNQALARINELAALSNRLVISSQVIREYANASLRNAIYHKLDLSSSINIVNRNINRFQRDFVLLYDSEEVLANWMILLPSLTTNRDIYDFNIAATLRTYDISHILTHNISDFVKFKDWLTILPLFPET